MANEPRRLAPTKWPPRRILSSLSLYTYIHILRVSSKLEPSRDAREKLAERNVNHPRLSVADGAPFSKIHSNLGLGYIKEGREGRYDLSNCD